MKIDTIFVEEQVSQQSVTIDIIKKFPKARVKSITNYGDIWGRVKRPYLHKRENLNLFIAAKKGALVKEAPDAYGLSGESHFYFVHAYNCIYECDYCYLQGYFNTPDLVLFVNHHEVVKEMKEVLESKYGNVWFHAGEFSDSLALTHLTNELSIYHEFARANPRAIIELRTKSANIRKLQELEVLSNFVTSFSLSPADKIKKHDLKTPGLKARLSAIKKLHELGHPIGIHLDPIIHSDNFEQEYKELIDKLDRCIPLPEIEYISVGVVRFTKDVYNQVKMNYPNTTYFHSELTKAEDGKIRYPRPMRHWILSKVKALCIEKGAIEKSVYLCMED